MSQVTTDFRHASKAWAFWFLTGFDRFAELMDNLGRHKTGKSCLYIKQLGDIDLDVLEQLIAESVERMRQQYS